MKTDIITFSTQLQSRLQERLDELQTDPDNLQEIGGVVTFIRSLLRDLKQFASGYEFADQPEEIRFFKELKPAFLSQYFYYKNIFSVKLLDSFKDVKSRRTNYYRLLRQLERFVIRNRAFYEYCMSGSTHKDKDYFIRSKGQVASVDCDEKFTTGFDTRLGKILAGEELKKYILVCLQRTRYESPEGLPALTWTGSKTALIELIYALQSAEVFNKGAADIKLLASTFSFMFGISLGNYYRALHELRTRKISPTAFIDELKKKLQERIDALDE